MGVSRFRDGMLNVAMIIAALVAITFNTLVPPGFMTEATADGGLRVVLCSGIAPVQAPAVQAEHAGHAMVDPAMGEGGGRHGDVEQPERCHFAGHAAPSIASTPVPTYPEQPRPRLAPLAVLSGQAAAVPRMPAPPPPSQAPPLLLA